MRALSHLRLRLRRAVGRYADGELDATSRRALAAHLLECNSCRRELTMVRAIKDSLRRLADAEPPALAATRLRRWTATLSEIGERPSPERRDRTRIAVRSAPGTAGSARGLVERGIDRRFRRFVGVAAMLAVAAALFLHRGPPSPEPSPMAALVELASLDSARPASPADRDRHSLELEGQRVSLLRRTVDGRAVLIAISERPFAMPADARPVGREPGAPWLATRGDLSVACLSRPAHTLVVGPLPAERLLGIGLQVG